MRYLSDALIWLADGTNWSGRNGVGNLLWEHIWYSLLAVAFSAVIAIPLGWWIGHTGRGKGFVVASTGAARALPTVGVLTMVALLVGRGLLAPMVAFVVLGVPSVLAGAYAGIQAADRHSVDGARAIGMSEWQILTRVEVPLGLPLVLGGVRSATLQIIATATLAAYVGSGGLGRLMFLGLRTANYGVMLAGSLLVIALAVISEVIFTLAQYLTRPSHTR